MPLCFWFWLGRDRLQGFRIENGGIGGAGGHAVSPRFTKPFLFTHHRASSRRVDCPVLSYTLRRRFLITCSLVPISSAICLFFKPCATSSHSFCSRSVGSVLPRRCSRGSAVLPGL